MRAPGYLLPGTIVPLILVIMPSSVSRAGWVLQESGTAVDLHDVQFLGAQDGFAVGESGTVLRTSNGGSTWTDVSISTSFPIRDLSMISASSVWVAAGDPNNSEVSGAVWHTTDGGATWAQQALTSPRARFGISFVSPATGWACGARNGSIDFQATTNGGTTWFNESSQNVFGWTYGIDGVSPSLVWSVGVVFFPSASGFVVHSSDGGASWTRQTGAGAPFLYGIDLVDPAIGFAAGDQGTILATTNGGMTWNTQASGTSSNLTDVSFSSATEGSACGEGGTILATGNGGQTWVQEQTPTSAGLNGIFGLDGATAWAAGQSGTILKRETATGVAAGAGLASPPAVLLEGHPNPFGPRAAIGYRLPRSGRVSLAVFSPGGRQVAVLVDEPQAAGHHQVLWDGTDQQGQRLPSGAYFLRLKTEDGGLAPLRMVILR